MAAMATISGMVRSWAALTMPLTPEAELLMPAARLTSSACGAMRMSGVAAARAARASPRRAADCLMMVTANFSLRWMGVVGD